jgi:hypothetical protein
MSLLEHAERELKASGAGEDYDGMIGKSVLQLIDTFAKQGHSGYSAMITLSVFDELARFKPLGPLTDNPDEWMEVDEKLWQSRRRPDAFSSDGGKTYYLLDDDGEVELYTSESSGE